MVPAAMGSEDMLVLEVVKVLRETCCWRRMLFWNRQLRVLDAGIWVLVMGRRQDENMRWIRRLEAGEEEEIYVGKESIRLQQLTGMEGKTGREVVLGEKAKNHDDR